MYQVILSKILWFPHGSQVFMRNQDWFNLFTFWKYIFFGHYEDPRWTKGSFNDSFMDYKDFVLYYGVILRN